MWFLTFQEIEHLKVEVANTFQNQKKGYSATILVIQSNYKLRCVNDLWYVYESKPYAAFNPQNCFQPIYGLIKAVSTYIQSIENSPRLLFA